MNYISFYSFPFSIVNCSNRFSPKSGTRVSFALLVLVETEQIHLEKLRVENSALVEILADLQLQVCFSFLYLLSSWIVSRQNILLFLIKSFLPFACHFVFALRIFQIYYKNLNFMVDVSGTITSFQGQKNSRAFQNSMNLSQGN